MMKRNLFLSMIFIVLTGCSIFPKTVEVTEVNKTLEGIYYQLGPENSQNTEKIDIEIKGELELSKNNEKKFSGTFNIRGIFPPPEAIDDNVEIIFNEPDGSGYIMYSVTSFDMSHTRRYGPIYMNDDFTQVTIIHIEIDEETNTGHWAPRDGFMISAPASNRTEALEISNELMKDYLGDDITLK